MFLAMLAWLLRQSHRRGVVPPKVHRIAQDNVTRRQGVPVRVPRFEFDDFPGADRQLGLTPKSAGHTYGRGSRRAEAELRAAGALPTVAPSTSTGDAVLFVSGAGAELATCLAEAIAAAHDLGRETWILGCDPGSAAALAADQVIVDAPTLANVLVLCASGAVSGVVLQFAGDLACALARGLAGTGVPVLGTSAEAMARCLELARPARADDASFAKIGIDVVADGTDAVLGGVLAYVEPVGVHSADSAAILPPQDLADAVLRDAEAQAKKLALALGIRGAMSVQFAVRGQEVHVLEVTGKDEPAIM